jgi:dolichol-phosphate mannosyltransferase
MAVNESHRSAQSRGEKVSAHEVAIAKPRWEIAGSSKTLCGYDLSVIVPTFNEVDNVSELVSRLDACLEDISWEVIFVDDDSPDGTANLLRTFAAVDPRVRCLRRIGRRGLSSACIEGMLSSSALYLAVIDGDLQHDETLLPQMIKILRSGDADIVVGSRYTVGGETGEWGAKRLAMSHFATLLSRRIVRADLKDPMSGFFMIRRGAFEYAVRNLSGVGFKILLDLFASSPTPLRYMELPYRFQLRRAGESKLDSHVAWDFLMLLLDKLIGHIVPVRFAAFALVGGLGIVIHLLVFFLLFREITGNFALSQSVAAAVAMTSNFALNNLLTYRDMRLKGWSLLRGWASFTLVCSLGMLANVGIASYLFLTKTFWLLSALAGILVGAVWNYAVTAVFTWDARRPDA